MEMQETGRKSTFRKYSTFFRKRVLHRRMIPELFGSLRWVWRMERWEKSFHTQKTAYSNVLAGKGTFIDLPSHFCWVPKEPKTSLREIWHPTRQTYIVLFFWSKIFFLPPKEYPSVSFCMDMCATNLLHSYTYLGLSVDFYSSTLICLYLTRSTFIMCFNI